MGRCLLHSHRPQVLLPVAKDWVASGDELLAFGRCAQVLSEAGIPLARQPAYSGMGVGDEGVVSQMLHPRIQGSLLGEWGVAEEREALERQGFRRIDLLVIDLPLSSDAKELGREDMAAALLLRAAAWNHRWVLPLSDLADVADVLGQWTTAGDFDAPLREILAMKALVLLGRLDASLSQGLRAGERGESPESWVYQARSVGGLRFDEKGPWRFGLYSDKVREGESGLALEILSGSPMSARIMIDADLASRCLSGLEAPAVVLAHNSGLCGFQEVVDGGSLTEAFGVARRSDPRGAFGSVLGVNRSVDAELARAMGTAFIEAVVAPEFDAEARASLGKTRIRLMKSPVDPGGGARSACHGTRWGALMAWTKGALESEIETLSRVQPGQAQSKALAHAWRLARNLPGIAMVAADERGMRVAAWAQTSLREAARWVAQRLGTVDASVAVACDSSFRFAEDVRILANCGVGAVLHMGGSPRQDEITARADDLGLVMQVVDEHVLAGKV